MKVFPHLLIRAGGKPFLYLDNLHCGELLSSTVDLQSLETRLLEMKKVLSKELLQHQYEIKDPQLLLKLKKLRKELTKNRLLKADVTLPLPLSIQNKLKRYVNTKGIFEEKLKQFQYFYQKSAEETRRSLQVFSCSEELTKGLLLSSQVLLDRLMQYQSVKPASFKKKQYQTELGVLKYMTRICAKTTPFSTFNYLLLGSFSTETGVNGPFLEKAGETVRVTSHIRLNNSLYKFLKGLLTNYRELYPHLNIRCNPTIRKTGGEYLFLTNYNNIDAFQRIACDPVIDCILSFFSKGEGKGRLPYKVVLSSLTNQVDASPEELNSYLKQLTELGILEFELKASGTDPDWDLKLIAELRECGQGVNLIEELIQVLEQVRTLLKIYEVSVVPERKIILNRIYEAVKQICLKIQEVAGYLEKEMDNLYETSSPGYREDDKNMAFASNPNVFQHKSPTHFYFQPEQMLYEDCKTDHTLIYSEEELTRFTAKLNTLLKELGLFQANKEEREELRSYFMNTHGPHGKADLLDFYESYYRNLQRFKSEPAHKDPELTAASLNPAGETDSDSGKSTPFSTTDQVKQGYKNWIAIFKSQVAPNLHGVELNLSNGVLKETNALYSGILRNRAGCNSFGAMVQFFEDEGVNGSILKGVVNTTLMGYGKAFSRFLHLFDNKVTEDHRAWNNKLSEGNTLFVENCDASFFNANLHPPLFPYEVKTPGGNNMLSAEQQLLVSDFEVSYNSSHDEVALMHKPTGKNAFLFDLGFEAQRKRSKLFQLLDKFTKAEYLSSHTLPRIINSSLRENSQATGSKDALIEIYPRIVYEEQLILQRKHWMIPNFNVPAREPNDTPWAYFLKIQNWRNELGIPEEVFVTVNPKSATLKTKGNQRKTGKDDYKPQYINFTNPLLVELFGKIALKSPEVIKVEEMLPSSKQLARIGNGKYVTETLLQWYNYA